MQVCRFAYLLSVQIHGDVVGGLAAHGQNDSLWVLQAVDVHHHLHHQVSFSSSTPLLPRLYSPTGYTAVYRPMMFITTCTTR